jgi:arylsulfatase A-like enzyme
MLSRRDFISSAAEAFALFSSVSGKRPNIVLLVSDDQGFGDLSLHGNPNLRTPNLDRIAQEGAEFTQFLVNPVCSPTRASLMTGRYYYRTGVVDTYLGRSMMHHDEVTIAETLRSSGYRTGIFGKWHLGDHYPLRPSEQGFEEVLVHAGGGIGQPSDPPDGNSYFNPKLMHNGRLEQRNGYCTDVFFDAALDFIKAHKDHSFFAYIATNAPHVPLEVADTYVAPFRKQGLDETTAKTYGMLANLDENAGRLLAHLRKLKLEENTILIFMSDNGPTPARFNCGLRGLKGSVYEGGLRVPFFVRWPSVIKPGTKIDKLAAHIDVFPTLLQATGAIRPPTKPVAAQIDGMSLCPLLTSPQSALPNRTLYFQWHRGDRGELYNNCAARDQRYKLVNGKELYDLQEDPSESRDLSAAQPERVAAMRAGYEAWFQDVSSTRNFEPPLIDLGTTFENPVLLTRQDWRGPLASWSDDGLGYWEVNVKAGGTYECTLTFPPTAAEGTASVSLGEVKNEVQVPAGATSATILLNRVKHGPSRLESALVFPGKPPVGPHYVNVRRIIEQS